MKNRYKIAIGCAGLVTLGAALWPQVSFGQQNSGRTDSMHKVVSKRFDNANASQVLAWLVEQGFNYVAKDNEFADVRVSLNIDHKTLKQAADDLASALGGHWSRDNGVYIFHQGTRLDGDSNFVFSMNDSDQAGNAEQWAKYAEDWAKQNKDWSKNSQDWAKWGQDYAKNMQKDFGPDSKSMKELQEKMKGLGDQMGKIEIDPGMMKDLTDQIKKFKDEQGIKDGDHMSQKQADELQKKMEAWGDKFGKSFSQNMGDDKKWQEFGKSMQDWAQQFEKQQPDGKSMEEWAKAFAKDHPNGEQFNFKNMPPMPPMPPMLNMKGFSFEHGAPPMPPDVDGKVRPMDPPQPIAGSSVKAAIRSLSESQKSLMQSRGYLVPSDLTDDQRDMLNLPTSGTWEMDFKIDGTELRIKDR